MANVGVDPVTLSQLSAVLEHGFAPIWVNLNGRIVFANHAICELLRAEDPQQIVGLTPFDIILPEFHPLVRQRIGWVLNEGFGPSPSIEERLRRFDGTVVPVEVTAWAVRLAEGTALQVTFRDLSQQRAAEIAIREQEALFRGTFENAAVGVAHVGMNGEWLRVNQRLCEILGYSKAELVSRSWHEITHPDDLETDQELTRRLKTREIPFYTVEKRYIRKDGSILWANLTGSLQIDRRGEAAFFIAIVQDITSRRVAEQALLEAHQRLQVLMESLPVGVSFSLDSTCRQITGNGVVLEQFEWQSGDNVSASATDPEAPGRKVRFFVSGREIRDSELPLQRAVAENRIIPPMEMEVILPSGRSKWVEGSGAPIRDKDGNVVAGVAVTVDITERKNSQKALLQAEKLATVGRIAATISHEINNPLEAVTNCLFIATSTKDLPEHIRNVLETAQQELNRASHISCQALGFYRDASHKAETDVAQAVSQVTSFYNRKLKNKDIELRKEDFGNPRVFLNPGELKQIVANLIGNAIDAVPPGGHIKIRVRERPSGARVVVADNGSGISPYNLKLIFEPFFTTKESLGTGLGLWVTRELLAKNGGQVRVRSRVAKGTVFVLDLPNGAVSATSAG